MRVVLDDGAARRQVQVDAAADATVGHLLDAAGHPAAAAVRVGGRAVPRDHGLDELGVPDGGTVEVVHAPAPRPGPVPPGRGSAGPTAPGAPRLAVVGGVDAGVSVGVDREVVVGRASDADLVVRSGTVSARHCRVAADGAEAVLVTDLGTTNGTWVDDVPVLGTVRAPAGAVLRCGATLLRVEPPAPDDRPRDADPVRHLRGGRAVPFNRPPRPGQPAPPEPLAVPGPVAQPRPATGVSVLQLVAPVLLGLVMVRLMGDWRYALLLLLGPVMLLGNAATERRRVARERREGESARAAGLARLAEQLVAAAAVAGARRWEQLPSVAEVARRAAAPSTRLWERRPGDVDALRLVVGVGAAPWSAPLREGPVGGIPADVERPDDVARLLAAHTRLPRTPVAVDLAQGGVVGVVGEPSAARALARSLLAQACVLHGPADLAVGVVAEPHRVDGWGWTTWLPHTALPGGAGRRLAVAGPAADALLAGLRGGTDTADAAGAAAGAGREAVGEPPTTLLVLDAPGLLRGRDADARAVLRGAGGPVAGIVLAATADQLPAVCDTVVTVTGRDGEATVARPAAREEVGDVLVAGLAPDRAEDLARALAGLEDPEQVGPAGRLPARVDLLDLLDGDASDPADVARTWADGRGGDRLAAPVGVGPDGPVVLDLVRDGPHGLLGGTTGSGKSELLRTLVAGLAASYDPGHCTFLLLDYKGGAAFDACARLPHVVGLVTDLDEHLGARALRCLEAELAHRERRLRDAGVGDLVQWHRLPPGARGDPLPRLLVVVDEFATLRAELPGFVRALVGVAQRGRSLGVHLLLGTQRPSGAVDEDVRANSNLRIALRVTDTADAVDVVGVPDAAHVPPSLPGRGVLRVGPGAVVPVQTALVSGAADVDDGVRVRLRPLAFGPAGVAPATTPARPAADVDDAADGDAPDGGRTTDRTDDAAGRPSDLARLVEACRTAADAGGHPPPRRPWPPPLPAAVPLAALLDEPPDGPGALPMARVDLPEEQAQRTTGWEPGAGNLLVHGVVGSGTTTTAAAAVLAATHLAGPDELHVVVLDLGRGDLAPLVGLPHCGAVVTAREQERRQRLLRWLVDEVARRRQLVRAELDAEPRLLLVVDGLTTLLDELDDVDGYEQLEAVQRALADAPSVRAACVLTSTRVTGLRSALTATVEQRWAHRLGDPTELAALGLRPADVPGLVPGRAVRVADGRELQVGDPGDLVAAVAAVAARWPAARRPPPCVRTLPTAVADGELDAALALPAAGGWVLPLGRRDDDLGLAGLALHRGEHGVVLGPPASGRSGLLGAVGAAVARHGTVDVLVAAGDDGSPLLGDGHRVVPPEGLGDALALVLAAGRPTLVLVDDAERVPPPGAVLDALGGAGARVHVLAAARESPVRADLRHWVRQLARSRTGAVLRPSDPGAAELLQARLPRRPPATVAVGRGWLVEAGAASFLQFADLSR